jgi:thiosulfate reductase cytochrome b subunit
VNNQPLQIQQPLLQLLLPSVLAIQAAAAASLPVAAALHAVWLAEYAWVMYVLANLMTYKIIQKSHTISFNKKVITS